MSEQAIALVIGSIAAYAGWQQPQWEKRSDRVWAAVIWFVVAVIVTLILIQWAGQPGAPSERIDR